MTQAQKMLAARRLRDQEHLSYRAIGQQLGVPHETIRTWCVGRPSRPNRRDIVNPDRALRIHALWHTHVPTQAIADDLGVSVATLRRMVSLMRRHGWDLPDRRKVRVR